MPRLTYLALLALTLAPALAQATTPGQSVTPPGAGVSSTDAAAQSALLDRLLRQNGGPQVTSTVTLGAIPAALPITLHAPIQVQATVRTTYPTTASYRIYAVSSGDLDEVRRGLAADMTASGWLPQPQPPQIGFRPTQGNTYSNFYRDGPFPLTMNAAVQTVRGRAELDINVSPISVQAVAGFRKSTQGQPQSSLPTLRPLPGAVVKAQPYTYTAPLGTISSARVSTGQSAGEVFAFYSAQLKAAGWKAVSDNASGPLRAVTYLLSDLNGREAVGTLGIRTQAEGDYVLTASVSGFKPF